ncbi:MAG TPA: FtsW/RodA/SpoVE family cell cycle protein, partial [Acidimicrobiales bacterium]|nr:FtsW/RodA/SpoVE family cell cycle protein [Acidimicrobiales bacterium]
MVDTSSLRTSSRTASQAATRGRHPSSPTRTAAPRRPAAPARRSGIASRLARVPTATGLLVLVGVLCVFGLVMVGSASPVISMSLYGSTWGIFIRQVMWMGIGLVALAAFSRIDYRKWRKIQVPLLIGSMGLLVIVLAPGLGVTAGGSSRWIGFGQFRLQPSEL